MTAVFLKPGLRYIFFLEKSHHLDGIHWKAPWKWEKNKSWKGRFRGKEYTQQPVHRDSQKWRILKKNILEILCDLFGMVSSRDPFRGYVTSNQGVKRSLWITWCMGRCRDYARWCSWLMIERFSLGKGFNWKRLLHLKEIQMHTYPRTIDKFVLKTEPSKTKDLLLSFHSQNS